MRLPRFSPSFLAALGALSLAFASGCSSSSDTPSPSTTLTSTAISPGTVGDDMTGTEVTSAGTDTGSTPGTGSPAGDRTGSLVPNGG